METVGASGVHALPLSNSFEAQRKICVICALCGVTVLHVVLYRIIAAFGFALSLTLCVIRVCFKEKFCLLGFVFSFFDGFFFGLK